MKKINNRGQSLVLFVLLLPIMLLIMVLVIDIGRLIIDRQDLNNINYLVVSYGVNHIDSEDIENELVELIYLNCSNLSSVDVSVSDDKVLVTLSKNSSSVFSKIFNFNLYKIRSSYVGYGYENKIERIK
jgi:uncharacterized membrane protein